MTLPFGLSYFYHLFLKTSLIFFICKAPCVPTNCPVGYRMLNDQTISPNCYFYSENNKASWSTAQVSMVDTVQDFSFKLSKWILLCYFSENYNLSNVTVFLRLKDERKNTSIVFHIFNFAISILRNDCTMFSVD